MTSSTAAPILFSRYYSGDYHEHMSLSKWALEQLRVGDEADDVYDALAVMYSTRHALRWDIDYQVKDYDAYDEAFTEIKPPSKVKD